MILVITNIFISFVFILGGILLVKNVFRENINKEVRNTQSLFSKLLEKEKSILIVNLSDYIYWMDLGEKGVKRRDKEFLEANINPWVKKTLKYDVILFTKDGEIITSSFRNIPKDFLKEKIKEVEVFFYSYREKVFLCAVGPVMSDDKRYFYDAYLLFAKPIDEEIIREWENFLDAKITILNIGDVREEKLRNYYEYPSYHIEIPLSENILVHIEKESKIIYLIYRSSLIMLISFTLFILISSLLISQFLISYIMRPFEKLVLIAREIERGNYDVDFDIHRKDEIGDFMRAFKNMIDKIKIREEKLLIERNIMKEIAYLDVLTQTYNRRYLDVIFKELVNKNIYFSLVFVDIDNFKDVNDKFGHDVGDQILKEVVEFFKKNFRSGDVIIRFGGDEFCIILINTTREMAEKIMKRTLCDFKERFSNIDGISLGFSFGIASYPEDSKSLDELIKIADERMYKDKEKK
uniref:diguanylate cyclase n=1 Tax=Dictyoglomus thermophilum TaxID=14 RepID=A0A7C3MNF2_DICTH